MKLNTKETKKENKIEVSGGSIYVGVVSQSILITLFIVFLLLVPDKKCPEFQKEIEPIYKPIEERIKTIWIKIEKDIYQTNFTTFTTATATLINGKLFIKIGEEPNENAIKYNQRVKECKTANGEF